MYYTLQIHVIRKLYVLLYGWGAHFNGGHKFMTPALKQHAHIHNYHLLTSILKHFLQNTSFYSSFIMHAHDDAYLYTVSVTHTATLHTLSHTHVLPILVLHVCVSLCL